MTQGADTRRPDSESFLPDFCSPRVAFAVVLIAEIVAIALILARDTTLDDFWLDLAKVSFLFQWIALSSALVLCYARPRMGSLSTTKEAVISLALLLTTIAVVSEAVFWLGQTTNAPGTFFPQDRWTFLLRNLGIGAIVSSLLLRYFYVAHQWRRNVELQAQAKVEALQARIRPHFLFNSMNTIAELTRSDPVAAEHAVEDLADLFRASLSERQPRIPLKKELEVARIYQRMEERRLGDRLKVRWDVKELPMRSMVPSLTVQPLLENAIYHGIAALPEGGTVVVSGSRVDGNIRLSVTNPVPPASSGKQYEGNRQALANIEQRLELAYGGRASVHVEAGASEYRVTLVFPYATE